MLESQRDHPAEDPLDARHLVVDVTTCVPALGELCPDSLQGDRTEVDRGDIAVETADGSECRAVVVQLSADTPVGAGVVDLGPFPISVDDLNNGDLLRRDRQTLAIGEPLRDQTVVGLLGRRPAENTEVASSAFDLDEGLVARLVVTEFGRALRATTYTLVDGQRKGNRTNYFQQASRRSENAGRTTRICVSVTAALPRGRYHVTHVIQQESG